MRITDTGTCDWNFGSVRGTCALTTSGGSWNDASSGFSGAFQLIRMSRGEARATKAGLGGRDDFDAPDQV
jgi:hypothetical protein